MCMHERASVCVCLHAFMPVCKLQAVKLITIQKTVGHKARVLQEGPAQRMSAFAAINSTTTDFP